MTANNERTLRTEDNERVVKRYIALGHVPFKRFVSFDRNINTKEIAWNKKHVATNISLIGFRVLQKLLFPMWLQSFALNTDGSWLNLKSEQECIPVGCVPAERWPYSKNWRHPPENLEQTPPKIWSRHPPENLEQTPTPPWKFGADTPQKIWSRHPPKIWSRHPP